MSECKCKVSAYLTKEELRRFEYQVLARGVTQSAYIREMLGFDVRSRGAPKGPRKKKAQKAKAAKPKVARKKNRSRSRGVGAISLRLPFPD